MEGLIEMKLTLYQIDAFTSELFKGNPAAVCPLDKWLPDKTMQAMALENNLSETAFFVPTAKGFHIRWFTPAEEVDLCGHATLASAHVVFNVLDPKTDTICFESRSGDLLITRDGKRIVMDFPSQPPKSCPGPEALTNAFHVIPSQTLVSEDYIAVFDSASDVAALEPDMEALRTLGHRGVITTAKGDHPYDFVLRCFFPKYGVPEDPVTGSALTQVVPYWAAQTGKSSFLAFQSSKRGGEAFCNIQGDRVKIAGTTVQYMKGTIFL